MMANNDEGLFVAQRLQHLMETIRQPNGKPYSYRQVAAGIKQLAAENPRYKPVTASYIWKLARGTVKNPGYSVLQSLAKFFEVDVHYFDEKTDQEIPAHVILARQLTQSKALDIASKAVTLTDEEQEMVLAMMETIIKFKEEKESQKD